jgi:branched-chain amino acid aminotransferase
MIFFDGSFFKASGFSGAVKRATTYGDGIFETCLLINGTIPLWSYHLARINKSTSILKMDWLPEKDQLLLENDIQNLLPHLADHFPGINTFRLRINLARSGEGKYLPQSNAVVRWLEAEPLKDPFWSANIPAFRIAFNPENIFVQTGLLAGLKTINSLPYIMASFHKTPLKVNEIILSNPMGKIADTCSYSIYIIKGTYILSPPISDGALNSVSRNFLKDNLPDNYTFHHQSLTKTDLMNAEGIFLSNALRGLVPVAEIEGKPVNYKHLLPLMEHFSRLFISMSTT